MRVSIHYVGKQPYSKLDKMARPSGAHSRKIFSMAVKEARHQKQKDVEENNTNIQTSSEYIKSTHNSRVCY